jgi:hypothetical protein
MSKHLRCGAVWTEEGTYHLLDPEHGLIVRRTKAEVDAELRRRKAVREAA